MAQLSVIVIAHNDGTKIEPTLRSVLWADELIVVDLESTDDTLAVSRTYASKVVTHSWVPYVERVRNYAASLASHEWVLLLDADERVSPELAGAISRFVMEDGPVDVVTLERNHIRFGRILVHSEATYGEATPRLFRKGRLSWPEEVHALPDLRNLRVAHLSRDVVGGGIEHNTWPTVDALVDRCGRYTCHEARDLVNAGYRYSTCGALQATWLQFASIYAGQRTYRDGVPGLFYALGMAMYRFLVWMHLWELTGREQVHDRPIVIWGKYVGGVMGLSLALARLVVRVSRLLLRLQPRRGVPLSRALPLGEVR